jgi:hypothetical protein
MDSYYELRYLLPQQSCMNMAVAAATRLNMTYHVFI